MKRVLFCGMGSMGTRHLRNLSMLFNAQSEVFEIDVLRSSHTPLSDEIAGAINKQFFSWGDVETFYDMIFITNPTAFHYETLQKALLRTKRIFLEKPAFNSIDVDIKSLALSNEHICYVAAPLRYTRIIRYLKDFLGSRKVFSVRAICSSYLPDWRPGTDWRKCYSANESMGGGVDIDLIHEWDYLVYLFGFPRECFNVSRRYSDVTVDSIDNAVYVADYHDKSVSLHLDYFGRVPRRQLELFLGDDVLLADFYEGQIRFLKSGEVIDLKCGRDDMQREELKYFLELQNDEENTNTIEHAVKVMRLAKGHVI